LSNLLASNVRLAYVALAAGRLSRAAFFACAHSVSHSTEGMGEIKFSTKRESAEQSRFAIPAKSAIP